MPKPSTDCQPLEYADPLIKIAVPTLAEARQALAQWKLQRPHPDAKGFEAWLDQKNRLVMQVELAESDAKSAWKPVPVPDRPVLQPAAATIPQPQPEPKPAQQKAPVKAPTPRLPEAPMTPVNPTPANAPEPLRSLQARLAAAMRFLSPVIQGGRPPTPAQKQAVYRLRFEIKKFCEQHSVPCPEFEPLPCNAARSAYRAKTPAERKADKTKYQRDWRAKKRQKAEPATKAPRLGTKGAQPETKAAQPATIPSISAPEIPWLPTLACAMDGLPRLPLFEREEQGALERQASLRFRISRQRAQTWSLLADLEHLAPAELRQLLGDLELLSAATQTAVELAERAAGTPAA